MRQNHPTINPQPSYPPTKAMNKPQTSPRRRSKSLTPQSSPRPPARHSPRLRLGRLLSLPRPRPAQIPNRRRLPPALLRLHPPPGLHLRRNPRVPLRARTHPRPQRREARSSILPRLGRRRGLRCPNSRNRGIGRRPCAERCARGGETDGDGGVVGGHEGEGEGFRDGVG
jgi:hypothetical protein